MTRCLVRGIGLTLVYAGKGASAQVAGAEVVEPCCLGRQLADDIAQAGPARKLCQAQCDELRPARYSAQFLALAVLFGESFKFTPKALRGAGSVSIPVLAIEKILCYDVPRLESPCYYSVCSKFHRNKQLRFKPFLCLIY